LAQRKRRKREAESRDGDRDSNRGGERDGDRGGEQKDQKPLPMAEESGRMVSKLGVGIQTSGSGKSEFLSPDNIISAILYTLVALGACRLHASMNSDLIYHSACLVLAFDTVYVTDS